MKRLVLLDSHAIIHRAWHALPPLMSPDGRPVNAVYGFASILLKILRELKPDYLAAAFDHEGPTFRHLAFERYKATRVKAPEALYAQIPLTKDLVRGFGIPALELKGYEADDVIGTIVREVEKKHPDIEIVIVTGDLDTLQLVDSRTKVFTMRKGVTDTVLYDEAAVRGRYGLAPKQLIDFKGLRGDPSDNIPGVKGIGEKTAAELLKAEGSIEGVYRALKKGKLAAKPAVAEALKKHEADALFSKTLVTIDCNIPVRFLLASSRVRKAAWKATALSELKKLGFESLVRRLGGEGMPAAPHLDASAAVGTAVTLLAVKHWKDIRRGGPMLLWKHPDEPTFLVAVASDTVAALPGETIIEHDAGKLIQAGPTYTFDLKALIGLGLPEAVIPKFRDLMIMWWLAEPDRRSYEPEILIQKELRRDPRNPTETASWLFELAPAIESRLRERGLEAVYETIEAPVTPILERMERTGIGLDSKPLVALSRKMSRELGKLERTIHTAAGGPFNINSPRQLTEVLFEKLKLAPIGIRKTEKSGALSTRESELVKLRKLHPIVGDILRYRELAKLKSTYADALPKLIGPDGRVHTTWNQTGTATGRLSSQSPNLQNIPIRSEYGREIRKAFRAARGYTLVAFDYSQLELRIAADLAHDEKMIAAFSRGLDIHKLTASEVNNLPIEKVTPELRARAKTLNFGVLYGMGARAFAETALVSRDEAEHFIEEYFRDFSGIARFIEEQKALARTQGFTTTAFGRKRFFPDIGVTNFRLAREAERQAVNFPIQGTEADIMKKAMIAVDGWIATGGLRNDIRMLLQIHDELIFEITAGRVKIAIPEITRFMEGAWSGSVAMKVEVKQGRTWGEL